MLDLNLNKIKLLFILLEYIIKECIPVLKNIY